MPKFFRISATLVAALGVTLELVGGGVAFGATTTPTCTPFDPSTGSFVAPEFQLTAALSMGSGFGSCLSTSSMGANSASAQQLSQAMSSILGTNSAQVGSQAGCNGMQMNSVGSSCVPAVPQMNMSCTLNPNGTFDPAPYQQALCSAYQSQTCATNQVQALQQANQSLCMINSEIQNLQNEINGLQPTFQQQEQCAQQTLTQIQASVQGAMNQQQYIADKLGSATGGQNGGGGGTGLLGLQQQLSANYQAMASQEQALETAANQWVNDVTVLPQRIQARQMALATQCFTQTNQAPCWGGVQCSYEQYLLESYYDTLRSSNGEVNTSGDVGAGTSVGQASSQQGAFQACLNAVLATVPTEPNIMPQNQSQAQLQQSQQQYQENTNTLTATQFDQLLQQDCKAQSIPASFVTQAEQMFNGCYNQVIGQPDQQITDDENQVNEEEDSIQKNANSFLVQYANLYSTMWSAFGLTSSLDLSQCQDTSQANISGLQGQVTGTNIGPEQQIQCAKTIMADVQNFWQGSPNDTITMTIPSGNTTVSPLTIACDGINSCVTDLQNANTNLKTNIQNYDQAQISFIQQANNNLQNFGQQIQTALKPMSQQINSQINQVQLALTNAGVSQQLNFPSVQPVQLQQTPWNDYVNQGQQNQGLYQLPANLFDWIAGGIQPGIPDPSQNSIQQAESAVGQQLQTDEQTDTQIAQFIQQIQTQKQECQTQSQQQEQQNVQSAAQAIVNACAGSSYFCDPNNQQGSDNLTNVESIISSISNDPTTSAGATSMLSSGTLCGQSKQNLANATSQLNSACTVARRDCPNSMAPQDCPQPWTSSVPADLQNPPNNQTQNVLYNQYITLTQQCGNDTNTIAKYAAEQQSAMNSNVNAGTCTSLTNNLQQAVNTMNANPAGSGQYGAGTN